MQILNAHPIPPRHLQHDLPDIPVLARIEWATGEETKRTHAYAHAPGLILVEIVDRRHNLVGAWLPIADVQKVTPQR